MDIQSPNNNNNNNNKVSYTLFHNAQTSHCNLSFSQTIQAQSIQQYQQDRCIIQQQHLDDFLPVEYEEKLSLSHQRLGMHPSNHQVCMSLDWNVFPKNHMFSIEIAKRHSGQRRRSTEQEEQRQKIFYEESTTI